MGVSFSEVDTMLCVLGLRHLADRLKKAMFNVGCSEVM